MPGRVLAGDVYAITQGSGTYVIDDSLVQNLSVRPWAELVSPEILSLASIRGQPFVVRGVDPGVFLRMDGGTWVEGGPQNDTWAAVGSGLQARLGLALGEYVTLTGSSAPRLALARVTGIFRTATPADDEFLVPISLARFLTGAPPGLYYSVRVKTSDVPALLAFLQAYGAAVQVTGPSGEPSEGASPASSPRLLNFLLLYGPGNLPPDYLSEGLAEATSSVRVAALGLAALVALLVALGIHALQARAFADRRALVGVLRAMGAGRAWLLRRAALEALPLAAVAALAGGLAGFALSGFLWSTSVLLAFGHAVRMSFDPASFALLVLAVVAASLASQALLLVGALGDRPGEAMREEPSPEPPVSLEVVLRG